MSIETIYNYDFVSNDTFVVVHSNVDGIIFSGLAESNSLREIFYKEVFRFSFNIEQNILNIWVYI